MTMKYDEEIFDMTSIGVVALVAIVSVVMIVLNLAPGAEATVQSTLQQPVGNAVLYDGTKVLIRIQFDASSFDFNNDNRFDFDDYADILAGKVDCTNLCDVNGDGLLNKQDQELMDSLVISLHDYNKNGYLDRADPVFLREMLLGNEQCTPDLICDLDNDGYVSKTDLTLFAALLFTHDLHR